MSAPPLIPLPDPADAGDLVAAIRRHLGSPLAAFLPRQRWYGDKGRPLAAVSLLDAAVDGETAPWFLLAIAEAIFTDGSPPARYLLPLAATAPGTHAADPLALLQTTTDRLALVDAFADPSFPRHLLRRLAESATLDGTVGSFVWEAFPALAAHVAAAERAPTRLIGLESSNSSVRFGDALFLKLVRRLRPGTNPDEEIGRFLAERTSFRGFPLPLGAGRYRPPAGDPYPFALAQVFVPSVGDGWDVTVRRLVADPAAAAADQTATILLGRRTAQLHLALASDPTVPAFAAEPITSADTHAWRDATVAHLRRVVPALDAFASSHPEFAAPVRRLHASLPTLARRAFGFVHLATAEKCRVHGDFHLGQLLRTPEDDWTILDFEGEPARTLAERRVKTSPLKDVAGMLRSFSYARSAATRALAPPAAAADDPTIALRAWERAARTAFLAAYRHELNVAESRLAPTDESAFAAAVAAWELDKAIYEVAYELNNRPDWLAHALDTLLTPALQPSPTPP